MNYVSVDIASIAPDIDCPPSQLEHRQGISKPLVFWRWQRTYATAVEQNFTATAEEAFLLLYARFLGAPGEGQEEGMEIPGCTWNGACLSLNRDK